MKSNTLSETTDTARPATAVRPVDPAAPMAETTAETTAAATAVPGRSVTRRPLQKRRFGTGLLLSVAGMFTILVVAFGGLQDAGLRGRVSLPVIGLCVIAGVMMLGGGFGLMATAAPGFDDDEFERLMRAGDPGNAPRKWTTGPASDSSTAEES